MKNTILIPPFFVLIGLILAVALYYVFPEQRLIEFPWNLAGAVVMFAGFVLTGKSRDLFHKHKTVHNFEDASFLITEGIFSKTRNPMYWGMLLFLLGISLIFCNVYSFVYLVLFFILLNVVYIPYEEKTLESIFGEQYSDYCKKVRRWL